LTAELRPAPVLVRLDRSWRDGAQARISVFVGTADTTERISTRVCELRCHVLVRPRLRQAQVWKTYFSEPTERKVADIDANKANLQHTLGAFQNTLFQIYNAIIRASPESREGVLAFFAKVVELNARRAGMSVPINTVSSDGYMTNLQVVLLKLFEPVMDASYSKVSECIEVVCARV